LSAHRIPESLRQRERRIADRQRGDEERDDEDDEKRDQRGISERRRTARTDCRRGVIAWPGRA
jgi:hypothetical protein